jgi:LPXTG-motif cell wall-anchored protein
MYKPAHAAPWEARRLLAILTALAVGMAVTLVFAGTAQAEHVDSWGFDAGPINGQNSNHEDYWEGWGAIHEGETDWVCEKTDQGSDGTFEVPAPPLGYEWRLLIVKKGSGDAENSLYWNPAEGEEYEHATGGGYSHIILCARPETVTSSSEDTSSSSSGTQATTSTTAPTTSSSSVAETTVTTAATTTSASVDQTTVTTAATTTSASVEQTTVTTAATSTSATVEGTTITTAPTSTVEDLPLTGMETSTLLGLGAALVGVGIALLALTRRPQED